MPKEQKKRGKREEKKRKREADQSAIEQSPKRIRSNTGEDDVEIKLDIDPIHYEEEEAFDARPRPGEMPFYGMLDEEEQEYFKQADTMLELNQFPNAEERELFLANVYAEANGKELKLANSQSCSRLMERLILSSTPDQLKTLFQKFSGHFLHLVQHRFASHCCETLFTQAAPLVTQELTAPLERPQKNTETGDGCVSVETLFLSTLSELEDNLGYLMTESFASHTLRVLLVVLSGRPLMDANTKALIKSKKAETITFGGSTVHPSSTSAETRTVPKSFHHALDRTISSMVAGLDTTYLRALATHPTGNPVLQLLIELELSRAGKSKAKDPASLFHKLLPDDPPSEGTESASFVNGLLYDTIGSRLLETIIQHAPGKTFKSLYKSLFRERLGSLARNEIASYPTIKILERLSKEELQHAVEQICPQVQGLVERLRTAVIKAIIERCRVREVDTQPIATAIQGAYGTDPTAALLKMLGLDSPKLEGIATDRQKQIEDQDVGKVHGSLLAQAMLQWPGPMRDMIMDSLIALDVQTLVKISKDRSATHVLQASLLCRDQEHASKFRRSIIQRLTPHAADLALDTTASHVVDAMWDASSDLKYPREQVARELFKHEDRLRQIPTGKAVWRNWRMDLYKRSKSQWVYGDGEKTTSETKKTFKIGGVETKKTGNSDRTKTPIELARERYAKGELRPTKKFGKALSGGNAVPVKGRGVQAR